ncbi:MAG: hypothetical protein HC896_05090 [Bacteroidales bacterium]|nr:hypothetical protein [Bacteroidales bacterium]
MQCFYVADGDTVLNKAQVESIKTIFIERNNEEVKNIYAAPVANSQDGLGAEIEDEEKPSWLTFGSTQMPKANIGFAIASNELLLAEGTRKITLSINYSGTAITNTSNLKVAFSGEKGWIEPSAGLIISAIGSSQLKVEATLNPEDPGVTPFDEKALGQNLGTSLPVMKLFVNQPEGVTANTTLNQLKDIKITSLVIDVNVTGVVNLMAYNDLSLLTTTKSFLPFGVAPVVGSAFYVGSAEAFHKNLKSLSFNIEWENKPANFWEHYLGYNVPGWVNGVPDNNTKLKDADFTVDAFNLKKSYGNAGSPIGPNKPLFSSIVIPNLGKTIDYGEKDTFGLTSKRFC